MLKEEARRKAFEYYASRYGHLILIDSDNAIYSKGYWAFVLRSNYPIFDEQKKMYLIKCENLGEIVIHESGAIAAATPREIVVKRLKKCLKER
jgi:hypothetical protein